MMCLSVLSVCHRLLMEARGWLALWKLVLLPSTMWFLGIRLKYGQALYPLKHLAGFASGFNPCVFVSCVPGLLVWAARPAFFLCIFSSSLLNICEKMDFFFSFMPSKEHVFPRTWCLLWEWLLYSGARLHRGLLLWWFLCRMASTSSSLL